MRALHTPQQETNVAYNPGVSYRGGEFIAQGISQAGNAISAGLAQFAKNREERDYTDQRMKTAVTELGKYRDFETDAADDKSPAGTLLKTFSNWDNKPLAAKKAALVDADHLISKGERNLERARAEQFQLLAVQDRQAAAENLQKHQADMLGVSRQGMALEGVRTLGGLFNQSQDNARLDKRLSMDEQNYAKLQEARRAKLESDTLMAGNLANFQRLAAEPTGPSRMGGDAAAALLSQPGTRLPDFSAYGPQDTQLTQQPLSMERVAQLGVQTGAWQNPQFNDLAKLYQGAKLDPIGQMNAEAALSNAKTNAAEAARRAKGGTAADKPTITITTKNGDQTVTRKVTETEFAALPQPVQRDAILDGQIAGLEAMEKRGAKKAELTDNGVSEPLFGGKPIGDLLAQLRARRGGGAAAPGPASGGSRFKVEEIK